MPLYESGRCPRKPEGTVFDLIAQALATWNQLGMLIGGGYHPGDTVAVLYDPELPQGTAIIDRGWWNWLLPGAVCLFGLLAGAAGLFMGRTGSSPQPAPSAFR